jgi:ribosome maturation factor RimP
MRASPAGLRQLIEPGVRALGFDLVDVELAGSGHRSTLRVYIDSPRGVTVDDCAAVSRQLSAVLDVEDPIRDSYVLEVSSPGLDRPLVTPAHFRRFAGEVVKVKTVADIGGRRNFKGRLLEADDERIAVEVDGQRLELTYEAIERARLVPQFD